MAVEAATTESVLSLNPTDTAWRLTLLEGRLEVEGGGAKSLVSRKFWVAYPLEGRRQLAKM